MRLVRLTALFTLIITVVAPFAAGASPRDSAARPNIIFVLTDDLASNLVTQQFMPNLWALMQQGATFKNYFVTDSLCCPSCASIFTGRLPHDTGVLDNTGADGGYGAFESHGDENSTFATDLQSAGYRTAMMGKYLNRYQTRDRSAPGWNIWDVANWGYPEFNYNLNENGRTVHYGGPNVPGKDNYLTDVISTLGNNFVRNSITHHANRPFFLELASFAPHEPYTPAPKYANLYPNLTYPSTVAFDAQNTTAPAWLGNRAPLTGRQIAHINGAFRKRAQDMRSIDDMIGSLEATVNSEGAMSNTYFVFSSDNGLHMGEHRLLPGKLTAFDTDIHVPLFVVGPNIPGGTTISAFAENIDLRSTFDALAETKPSEGVDGRSITPLLFDANERRPNWPHGVLVEHHGPQITKIDPDNPPPGSGNPPSYDALRLPHALYVEYIDGEREYYDLSSDPGELNNIYVALPTARIDALHGELTKLVHCQDARACSDVVVPAG